MDAVADAVVPALFIPTAAPMPAVAAPAPEIEVAPAPAIKRAHAPRSPPAPISLQVVRTHFLLI